MQLNFKCHVTIRKDHSSQLFAVNIFPLIHLLGEGHGNPLQYSCLENPRDRGVWCTVVHRVTKSWTRLSEEHFYSSIGPVHYK